MTLHQEHHLRFDVTAGNAAGIDAAVTARIDAYLDHLPDSRLPDGESAEEVEISIDVAPLTVGQDGTVGLWKASVDVVLNVPFPEA